MTFKGADPCEAMSTGAASSTVTDHDSYIEVRKEPQYGAWDSHNIEGSTTSYDAFGYRYGTGST